MVVTSANSDLYSPFSHRSMPEESGPSSEEGSGLHSPIFGVTYAHPDANLRYRTEHDIQNAAGILASQFDHNSGYSSMSHHQQHPGGPNANQLLDATLEPGPNSHPSQHPAQNTASHRYPADAYQPNPNMHPRNHLGIDIPVQTLSNTRLPPPPGQVYFDQSPDGHRHAQHYPPTPQDTGYGGSGGGPGGMMDPHGHSHPHDQQQQAAPGSATSSGGREPRKESSGVVIACRQCRARKIRCDSTRPVCNNCVRRSNECHYDAAPKRRGPDKRPGTRQRSCKKRPADGSAPPPPSKRKRSGAGASGEEMGQGGAMKNTFPAGAGMGPGPMPQQGYDVVGRGVGGMQGGMQMHPQHLPRLSPGAGMDLKPPRGMEQGQMFASHSPLSPSASTRRPYEQAHNNDYKPFRDVNLSKGGEQSPSQPPTPSMEYARKIWWEQLLDTYSPTRDDSIKDIIGDLSTLFNTTGYWLSFINVPYFIRNLYNPEARERMQPSLVYAGLALATLMKSSSLELGHAGRNRALWLRDAAHSNMEQSLNAGWIDLPLAEAALMLALFESSAHPQYSPNRAAAALSYLDNIIRRLQLTTIDAADPDVSAFKPHQVPVVVAHAGSPNSSPKENQKCACLPQAPPLAPDNFSNSWSYSPPWDPSWTPEQNHREECRRLCWSALTLVAGHSSQSAAFDKEPAQFYLTDPGNYALLFPGEISDRENRNGMSPKDSIWALYCRVMLLWNFTTRLSGDALADRPRAEYAYEVWVETQSIQDALDMHVCNVDTALLYMCREFLYNTRVTVTRTLRSLQGSESGIPHQPVFSRKEAEEWLYYQDQVIKRVKASITHLGEAQGHLLTRRPFNVTWFSSQLAICLSLWNNDRSLTTALELGKSVLALLDILNALWPCPALQARTDDMRQRLSEACTASSVPQPLPTDFALPSILKALPA